MSQALLDFLSKYPVFFWLAFALVIVAALVIIVIVANFITKGGTFKFFGLEASSKTKSDLIPAVAPTTTINPNITASPVQTVTQNTYLSLSEDQTREIGKTVAQQLAEFQRENRNTPPANLYDPPHLPDRMLYIYEVRHDIGRKIASIVLQWGGAWAGVSVAPFESFWSKAVDNALIPQTLMIEINDFLFMTQPILNSGQIPNSMFLDIQYQAAHISRELDRIVRSTDHNQRGFDYDSEPKG